MVVQKYVSCLIGPILVDGVLLLAKSMKRYEYMVTWGEGVERYIKYEKDDYLVTREVFKKFKKMNIWLLGGCSSAQVLGLATHAGLLFIDNY